MPRCSFHRSSCSHFCSRHFPLRCDVLVSVDAADDADSLTQWQLQQSEDINNASSIANGEVDLFALIHEAEVRTEILAGVFSELCAPHRQHSRHPRGARAHTHAPHPASLPSHPPSLTTRVCTHSDAYTRVRTCTRERPISVSTACDYCRNRASGLRSQVIVALKRWFKSKSPTGFGEQQVRAIVHTAK